MSRKTSPRRIAAFFAALEESGNQTLAAERARVSRSWMSLHRASTPGFRERMDAAIATARARLSAATSVQPPQGWGDLDGEELVVRGTNGRRVQVARARLKGWSASLEARFLTVLAATCNVSAACSAVGMTPASAFAHRYKWSDFERRWHDALETGYLKLEMHLIEQGNCTMGRAEPDLDAPVSIMSVDQAIHLLHMHKREVRGIASPYVPQRRHWALRKPDPEQARKTILKRVAAIKAHGRRQRDEDGLTG